jgi:tRNA pseudouridine32 synthase/23S rRNA pseudouridine746 synthase
MHQIRVHMAHMGAPILGDILYASPEIIRRANRLLLHAARITLPAEGEYPLREYSAPLPNDFLAQLPRELIEKMFND